MFDKKSKNKAALAMSASSRTVKDKVLLEDKKTKELSTLLKIFFNEDGTVSSEAVTKLFTDVETLTLKVTSLETQVTSLETQVTSLETQVASLETQVASLSTPL